MAPALEQHECILGAAGRCMLQNTDDPCILLIKPSLQDSLAGRPSTTGTRGRMPYERGKCECCDRCVDRKRKGKARRGQLRLREAQRIKRNGRCSWGDDMERYGKGRKQVRQGRSELTDEAIAVCCDTNCQRKEQQTMNDSRIGKSFGLLDMAPLGAYAYLWP